MDKKNLITELKEIFLNKVGRYETPKDAVRGYYNNEFSCLNGCINELIYYKDTSGLFEKYPIEAMELITYIESEVGHKIGAEHEDALCKVNHYIWAIFEYLTCKWIHAIEEEL